MIINCPAADQNNTFFLGNLNRINIFGITGESVTITLTIGKNGISERALSETYAKDQSGMVTLHDLRSLLEPFLEDIIKNGLPDDGAEPTSITLQVSADDGLSTASKQFTVAYSNGQIPLYPSMFSRFYTQVRKKSIFRSSLQYISAPKNSRVRIGLAYKTGDVSSWRNIVKTLDKPTMEVSCRSIISLLSIESDVEPDSCLYADFELLETDTDTVIDHIRFTYYNFERVGQHDTFLFTNIFGYPETMTFKGFTTETLEPEFGIERMDGMLSKFDNDILVTTKAFTGNMDEEHYALFQDMLHSRSLFLTHMDENGTTTCKRIVIDGVSATRGRHFGEIMSANINYSYAERFARSMYMDNVLKERIFDGSFGQTFE